MSENFYKKITCRHSAEIAVLFQHANIRGKRLLDMFPQYSRASIYRHAVKPISDKDPGDRRKKNKGRPQKLSKRDKRNILRAIKQLRVKEGSFTAPRIAKEAGVFGKVSQSTVRRSLNEGGYFYLQSRKKGLLLARDLSARVRFCRKVKSYHLGQKFWQEDISFYLDGKGFDYKVNPLDQARAPASREWRKQGEGLSYGCTSKGRKEGTVKSNFMVAISYKKGVVLCEPYSGSITGAKMAEIVNNTFPAAFACSINPICKRLLMDGCPRQNCKMALKAIENVGGLVFSIPARSPDLNPIENFFHLVSNALKREAIAKNITRETFTQFTERVVKMMKEYPTEVIDNIIDSMHGRIDMILKSGGNRIRY